MRPADALPASATIRHASAGWGALGAQAYASGTDIHFATGAYQPYTTQGQQLIARKLAHVV